MERRKRCKTGLLFLQAYWVSLLFFCIYYVVGFVNRTSLFFVSFWKWLGLLLLVILAESVLFWIGILLVTFSSTQYRLKKRIWWIVFGWIPVLHIFVIGRIIHIISCEISFEAKKDELNRKRADLQIDRTKYPILMVHGVFFRDSERNNYWGRIPSELQKNGATVFYGLHHSASSIVDSATELNNRILKLVRENGFEKINVIAHSKGGLDIRYLISNLEAGKYIASLTTINTPHRGCEFADYLLGKIPEAQKNTVAKIYNAGAKRMGDENPDFLAAVYDLTKKHCEEFNEQVKDSPDVYYQSVGSVQNRATSGTFPLNFSYLLVERFEKRCDGLVGEQSFPWGEKFTLLTVKGRRGISHGDMIDLNRENIKGFDVREFYVQLVSELREKGL